MIAYPIHVPRKGYRGAKPKIRRKVAERNRLAQELEDYLNSQIAVSDESIQQYLYYEIARETRIPIEKVRDILFGVDGGYNGLTVTRHSAGTRADTWV